MRIATFVQQPTFSPAWKATEYWLITLDMNQYGFFFRAGMRKQDARKLKPVAQEAIRLRVVDFLRRGKGTQQLAAGIFQVSLRAVEKAWHRYKAEGRRALRAKKRGPHHSTAHLSRRQAATIKTCVKKNTPEAYGLPYYLWTAEAVGRLIKKKHG